MRIHYDDIDDRLEDIWKHLIGDGFNQQRADMLCKLDIKVNDPHDIDQDAARALLYDYSISKA